MPTAADLAAAALPPRKRRKSFSLISNIMSDLGLTDVQKLFAVLAISWCMIALKYWLRSRPTQKARFAKQKAEAEARRQAQQQGYAKMRKQQQQQQQQQQGKQAGGGGGGGAAAAGGAAAGAGAGATAAAAAGGDGAKKRD